MLIMICLIVGLIAVCCLSSYSDWVGLFGVIFVVIDVICTIALILLTIQIIGVHVNPAACQAEKAMLEYRLDQKEYLNDNNVGMTELMEDITEYNSRIIKAQSPWVRGLC